MMTLSAIAMSASLDRWSVTVVIFYSRFLVFVVGAEVLRYETLY